MVAPESESLGAGSDLVNVDPNLGTLQDNGGSTATIELLSGSPAINGGDNTRIIREELIDANGDGSPFTLDFNGDGDFDDAIPYDQREEEFSRIFGDTVDIGAYEVQEVLPPQDNPPTVATPIEDLTISDNSNNQTIDLSNLFQDEDGDEIAITVQGNTNRQLVTTSIANNTLTLNFAENESGTAEITLRGTANGQTVEDTFTITVEPITEVTDNPPTVVTPIEDLTIDNNSDNQTIDLSNLFQDADGDEIAITVQGNTNRELVTTSIDNNILTLDFAENRSGTVDITLRGTAKGKTVEDTFTVTVGEQTEPPPVTSEQTIDLFRFRNTAFTTGTYVFVGEQEKNDILANNNLSNTFSLDGRQDDGTVNAAFTASETPGDDLISFYRLKSLDVLGTFLFVAQQEYDGIFAEDSDQRDKWEKEGLDADGEDIPEFYLYDGSSDIGTEFNRFQNTQNGTFLYAGEGETTAIEGDPNLSNLFTNQGVAFKSL